MQLMNDTPFSVERIVGMDQKGAEILALIVKATYDISPSGELCISAEQLPIEWADVYWGEPGKSSICYEADVALSKPATDVALIGNAYARRTGDTQVDVSLKIGETQKTIKVFGDRNWETFMGRSAISKPKPFEKIALIYESAFGGADLSNPDPSRHDFEEYNPVGMGFRAKHSKLPIDGTSLPNLENPVELIKTPKDRPTPACFGFIAKDWKPRIDYGGTYDDKWLKTKMPLLPDDFDERFNNAASPGLIVNGFVRGGEPVEIKNASPSGSLSFSIPKVAFFGSLLIDAKLCNMDMYLDTLVIDTNASKVVLVWRGSWNVHKIIEDVRWVRAELIESRYGPRTPR